MSAKTRLLSSSFAVAALTGLMSSSALAIEDADFRFDSTEDLVQVCSVPATAPEYLTATLACKAFIEATVQYHDQVTDRKKLKPSDLRAQDGYHRGRARRFSGLGREEGR